MKTTHGLFVVSLAMLLVPMTAAARLNSGSKPAATKGVGNAVTVYAGGKSLNVPATSYAAGEYRSAPQGASRNGGVAALKNAPCSADANGNLMVYAGGQYRVVAPSSKTTAQAAPPSNAPSKVRTVIKAAAKVVTKVMTKLVAKNVPPANPLLADRLRLSVEKPQLAPLQRLALTTPQQLEVQPHLKLRQIMAPVTPQPELQRRLSLQQPLLALAVPGSPLLVAQMNEESEEDVAEPEHNGPDTRVRLMQRVTLMRQRMP